MGTRESSETYPEQRPHYDFMVFGGPVGSRSQGAVSRLTHAGPAEEIVGKELIAYDIASDGNWFRMSFSCVNGKQGPSNVIKICHVSSQTGVFAPFAEAYPFTLDQIGTALAKGIGNWQPLG